MGQNKMINQNAISLSSTKLHSLALKTKILWDFDFLPSYSYGSFEVLKELKSEIEAPILSDPFYKDLSAIDASSLISCVTSKLMTKFLFSSDMASSFRCQNYQFTYSEDNLSFIEINEEEGSIFNAIASLGEHINTYLF